jgi:hypothetical protein
VIDRIVSEPTGGDRIADFAGLSADEIVERRAEKFLAIGRAL